MKLAPDKTSFKDLKKCFSHAPDGIAVRASNLDLCHLKKAGCFIEQLFKESVEVMIMRSNMLYISRQILNFET